MSQKGNINSTDCPCYFNKEKKKVGGKNRGGMTMKEGENGGG